MTFSFTFTAYTRVRTSVHNIETCAVTGSPKLHSHTCTTYAVVGGGGGGGGAPSTKMSTYLLDTCILHRSTYLLYFG